MLRESFQSSFQMDSKEIIGDFLLRYMRKQQIDKAET